MKITSKKLADFLAGKLIGAKDTILTGVKSLNEAKLTDLTFYDGNDETKLKFVKAGCVIAILAPHSSTAKSIIVVKNVRLAWVKILNCLFKDFPFNLDTEEASGCSSNNLCLDKSSNENSYKNIHIAKSAFLDSSVKVLPFSYIGPNVHIGHSSIIGPNVGILAGCIIGSNVKIGAGSVIGSEGFGYVTDEHGEHHHIPHLGNVVIEDNVEIGAGVCIDRGVLGETRIGKGTKIDNLVHIAHNVQIGKNCLIAGQCGIAGSSILADGVVLAGQVGIKDHISLGKGVVVLAKSAVFKDISEGTVISGIPARPHRQTLKAQARFFKDV